MPQQAWLQNATLKYNITFGKKVNSELYDRVVEVIIIFLYTASQKHESTLLHTYVLNEFWTADRLCPTKYF